MKEKTQVKILFIKTRDVIKFSVHFTFDFNFTEGNILRKLKNMIKSRDNSNFQILRLKIRKLSGILYYS